VEETVSSPSSRKPPTGGIQPSANDNEPTGALRAEVRIPADLPITAVEIEVFAALLEDWSGIAANDNEAPG
jgi:hypothetical protein